MAKLFSASDKKVLKEVNKPESTLNKFLCENFAELFPKLTFIKSEFVLTGNVRTRGSNGRIDIFAYNADTKRFVIFELKKDFDKNITDQAADYRDFIEDNFAEIYLLATQTLNVPLPKHSEIEKSTIEIILIAKAFSSTQIDRLKKIKDNLITLIRYYWFENDFVFIDYVNNNPDEDKADTTNAKKIKQIGLIATQDPDMYEIDRFFNVNQTAKDVFIVFYDFLKNTNKDLLSIQPQQVVMKVKFEENSFSACGSGGKGAKKKVLQINTNIDISTMSNVDFEDRVRIGQKKKGSLGTERYEVYFKDTIDMNNFIDFIKDKL